MLQQTPRTSDIGNGECSHLVPDAGEMAAAAHVVDGYGPPGGHARQLTARDSLCAAHCRPVHSFTMASQCGIGIHYFMQMSSTSEDVESDCGRVSKIHAHSGTRRHRRYNFSQWADIGRASARA